MRALAAILGAAVMAGTAAAPAGAETLRYAIMRNGAQIGTHRVVVNRTGAETTVNIATEVDVKVLFISAYHFQETESERWVSDHLVALTSTTDNNGKHHRLTVTQKGNNLECDADGKVSTLDRNIVPSSFWNPEFLRHTTVLDTEDGVVSPMSVIDKGPDQLTIDGKTIKTHHYEIKSRYPQDVWYDDRQNVVQVKLIGSDGSTITYKPV